MGPTLQVRLAERRGGDNTGGQHGQGGRPPPVSETRGGDNRPRRRRRQQQQQQEAGGSGQGHNHLDVVDGEHARAAIHAALEPVVVDAAHERDEVPLMEAQLALVLGVEVVQRPAGRGAGAPGWRPHRRWKRRRVGRPGAGRGGAMREAAQEEVIGRPRVDGRAQGRAGRRRCNTVPPTLSSGLHPPGLLVGRRQPLTRSGLG